MTTKNTWLEKDYYKTLGVSPKATQKQITHSYRKLAWKLHPDVNPGKKDDEFKELGEAYEVLNDPAKRKEYDELRLVGVPDGCNGVSTDGTGPRVGVVNNLVSRYFDRRYRPADRGRDLKVDVRISRQDAKGGAIVEFDVMSDAPCSTCDGTGAAAGTSPVVCTKCGGSGRIVDNQGFFSLPVPCLQCKGRGVLIEKSCSTCTGKGVAPKDRPLEWRVFPGIEDGSRHFYKGLGGAGRNGAPPGDLLVVVHVDRRKIFSSKGAKGKG